MFVSRVALFVLIPYSISFSALAQCVEDIKLLENSNDDMDTVAWDVAVDGDIVVVGSPHADDIGGGVADAGAVYVYRRNGATMDLELTIVSPSPETGDLFGLTVAVSGNRIAVGAPFDNDNWPHSGSVFVYRYQPIIGWLYEEKITSPIPATNAHFGYSVDIEGERILAGSPGQNSYVGAAFVFERVAGTWEFDTQPIPGSSISFPQFGWSVALDEQRALVGAPFYQTYDNGAFFLFERDPNGSWPQVASGGGSSGAHYGYSVDIDNDFAIIGAPNSNSETGIAVTIHRDVNGNWAQHQTLNASDASAGNRYGHAVAIEGNSLLVGAQKGEGLVADSGSVYGYTLDGGSWTNELILASSDGDSDDEFGLSVGMSSGLVVIGAPAANDSSGMFTNVGAAYVFMTDELAFAITPSPGTLDFDTSCGQPNGRALLTVTEINGVPLFRAPLFGNFGPDGAWTFSAPPPNPPLGISITFRVLGITFKGRVDASNHVTLDL